MSDLVLDPARTGLVIVDLQNDFLHPDGHYAQNGIDIGHMRRVIEPIAKLTHEARRRGVPIIWTRHGTRGVEDGGPFMRLRPFLKDGGLRQNTWGYEILEDLEPQPNDWYVEKTRLSGYFATNLDVTSTASLECPSILITVPIASIDGDVSSTSLARMNVANLFALQRFSAQNLSIPRPILLFFK